MDDVPVYPVYCSGQTLVQQPEVKGQEVKGHSRVVHVLPEHVERVVHPAAEVVVVEALGQRPPPAHVHLAADVLVQTLQLDRRRRERRVEGGGIDGRHGLVFIIKQFTIP